jgi:hypothetical protein
MRCANCSHEAFRHAARPGLEGELAGVADAQARRRRREKFGRDPATIRRTHAPNSKRFPDERAFTT